MADGSLQNLFTPILHSGPFELVLLLLLVVIGIYHAVVSVRVLARRHGPVSTGFHCLLSFSPPAILVLGSMALLPTTLPELFIVGIDADQPLKHTLELISVLGWTCLGSFVLNFCLTVCAHNRNQPRG